MPIVMSLAVPSSCVVTQTPIGTNSGTRRRKRRFSLLFYRMVIRGRIEIMRSMLSCLILLSGTARVVPAGAVASGRVTPGTTRAVPDSSTNHSSTDRILVNSYSKRGRLIGSAKFQHHAVKKTVWKKLDPLWDNYDTPNPAILGISTLWVFLIVLYSTIGTINNAPYLSWSALEPLPWPEGLIQMIFYKTEFCYNGKKLLKCTKKT